MIERLRLPGSIRVDAGVAEGDEVGVAYDPMIAKLIATAPTGGSARPAGAALDETVVEGVVTNLPFLRWLVSHPACAPGATTTAFSTEHPPLSAPRRAVRPRPWRGALAPQPPLPPPRRPPTDAAAHDHGTGAEQSALTAPMPGTVIRVAVAPGDRVERAPDARRARGDEDGDADRRARTRRSCGRCTCGGRPRRRRRRWSSGALEAGAACGPHS